MARKEPVELGGGGGGSGSGSGVAALRPTSPAERHEDHESDPALRPRSFEEFVGQRRVVDNLRTWIDAAKKREGVLDHTLFSGLPGLGKTTLARLISQSLGTRLVTSSGPAIERPFELAGILTKLGHGDVLFIDEIHRLPVVLEEYLYSAMEDFRIDIVMEQGPYARTVSLAVQRFTLVGATTREGLLTEPFRERFKIRERLEPYPVAELEEVVRRSAGRLGLAHDDAALRLLAERARGTPRVANRFLRRVSDVALVLDEERITVETAQRGLAMLGVDEHGLEALDRNILATIARAGGGPLGLKTIAVSVGEEERTIEDVYEPHLIREGLLTKTPRGRAITDRAYRLLAEAGAAVVAAGGRQRGLFA